METKMRVYKSTRAEALLGRKLSANEWVLLNYIHNQSKEYRPVETAVMQDLVRSRTTTYKQILDWFHEARIIRVRTGFVFKAPGSPENRCSRYLLDKDVRRELDQKRDCIRKTVNLAVEDLGKNFNDTTKITDDTTRHVLESFNHLSLDENLLKRSVLEVQNVIILRKFLAGVRNVRRSPNTGRISHLLLNSGSRAARKFFRIDGKKPVELDAKNFHFQLLREELGARDYRVLGSWLGGWSGFEYAYAGRDSRGYFLECYPQGYSYFHSFHNDFYGVIMSKTGINDRALVKKLCQQVLTDKKLGKKATKIQTLLFETMPSIKEFCQTHWDQGKTVQAYLQRKESEVLDQIMDVFREYGYPIIPLYDGLLIAPEHEALVQSILHNPERALSEAKTKHRKPGNFKGVTCCDPLGAHMTTLSNGNKRWRRSSNITARQWKSYLQRKRRNNVRDALHLARVREAYLAKSGAQYQFVRK